MELFNPAFGLQHLMDVAALCTHCVSAHLNIQGMIFMFNILLRHENPQLLTSALSAVNGYITLHAHATSDLSIFLQTMDSDQGGMLCKYEAHRCRERLLF